jgi:tRNA(Phe) wybutosine-synthesizing methylase Tyw3
MGVIGWRKRKNKICGVWFNHGRGGFRESTEEIKRKNKKKMFYVVQLERFHVQPLEGVGR